jgi:hypothetical protein
VKAMHNRQPLNFMTLSEKDLNSIYAKLQSEKWMDLMVLNTAARLRQNEEYADSESLLPRTLQKFDDSLKADSPIGLALQELVSMLADIIKMTDKLDIQAHNLIYTRSHLFLTTTLQQNQASESIQNIAFKILAKLINPHFDTPLKDCMALWECRVLAAQNRNPRHIQPVLFRHHNGFGLFNETRPAQQMNQLALRLMMLRMAAEEAGTQSDVVVLELEPRGFKGTHHK